MRPGIKIRKISPIWVAVVALGFSGLFWLFRPVVPQPSRIFRVITIVQPCLQVYHKNTGRIALSLDDIRPCLEGARLHSEARLNLTHLRTRKTDMGMTYSYVLEAYGEQRVIRYSR